MEQYIQIIFILAIIKFCLKAAMTGRLWAILSYAFGVSLFCLALYPIVIRQPLTIITDLLANKAVVTDMAVWTTVEAAAGIFISIFLLDNYFMEHQKRKRSISILKVIPGWIFIFGIAYFQLQFFKIRVGDDFLTTAIMYSSIIFVLISLMSLFLKYVVVAESMKLELKILLNIGILFIGLLVNSSIADYNSSHSETVVEWGALVTMFLICGGLVVCGYLLSKIELTKIFKINK